MPSRSPSLFVGLLVVTVLIACGEAANEQRAGRLLIDRAGVLEDISESTLNYLTHIRDDYQVEIVLATLPEIEPDERLSQLTAHLFSEWDVGRRYGGRGLLLILADKEKEVRIEVGSELEHVFTDLFTGYIETKQLTSYYRSGQLNIGLLAVLEEIEARAQLVSLDKVDSDRIRERDEMFLSGGGGADLTLEALPETAEINSDRSYPAGETPDDAWQTLIRSWRERNRNPDIGVYTPLTRLIYRAFTNQPERRFEEDVRTWGNKPYEIIEDGDYAVVYFGNRKGWENAPFLFCRTAEGWQFDMVHQRKLVRMGRAPAWGIERGEHPYNDLLSGCPYWMGRDIPLSGDDVYSVSADRETAARIIDLENQLKSSGDTFATLYELGRLYTITSMGQQRFAMLNRARKLQPDHPGVLKFLAVAQVDGHYQYETALALMQRYVQLRPEEPFGHFFLGYLYLMTDQQEQSLESLRKGLSLDPDNIYGLSKLARAHLARGRAADREQASLILKKLQRIAPNHVRVRWLARKISG
ncbi:MAG: TPM domain-containing protein [Desulfofustis sp.]|jgi:tetratricopeptide (TPR) repeat protein